MSETPRRRGGDDPLPVLLPGEDRSFGGGLFVDLVPSSCWFTNARSCLPAADWRRLRRMVLDRAGGRCEICGRAPDGSAGRRLEVHERWGYDQKARVQSLRRLIALCADCHGVTHFGLATVRGRQEEAFAHLRAVTGLSEADAREYVDAAFEVFSQLSAVQWTLDLGILTRAGLRARRPPSAGERARPEVQAAARRRAVR